MTNRIAALYNIFVIPVLFLCGIRIELRPFGVGRELVMAEIRIKDNESLDSALRRFKRSCARSGVLAEVRKREHYEKPSVKRKKKSEAARKRKFK